MLLGREAERRDIDRVLDRARGGESAALVLAGEPGIGKSALLDHAAQRATGMRTLRARGIESEARIPFASLLELLRPALGELDRLPAFHAAALEGALALRPAAHHERFAVGIATLGLLAAYAEPGPVLVLVDDAHWLDRPSGEAMLFALRRIAGDPVAALIAVRAGEDSPLIGADLPMSHLTGLDADTCRALVPDLSRAAARRLHAATAGNPLAVQELAATATELLLAPPQAPTPVPQRVAAAYVERLRTLAPDVRQLLCLAAASDSDDLGTLARAARRLAIEVDRLTVAEHAGLVVLRPGRVEFRHPLARSAIYAATAPAARREVHRALAAVLPDRDLDRRAWHLAAAATGLDEPASVALEHAGERSRDRSAFATASAAFEQAGRLTADSGRMGAMLLSAGEAAWNAGLGERATALLDDARAATDERARRVAIDELRGHIATRVGPIGQGREILLDVAGRAPAEAAVAMYAEAAAACFYAGDPVAMLDAARRATETLPSPASPRARFLAALADGMAQIFGGDAAGGPSAIAAAVDIARRAPGLEHDPRLGPWLAAAPLFLRDGRTGRALLEPTLAAARARGALDTLPFVLNLLARDSATTDRWSEAEVGYLEAIELARETEQRTELTFGLAGLAWLYARRGRATDCRRLAAEALRLSRELGCRLHEVWATAALAELALGLGDTDEAGRHFEEQGRLLTELSISDPDLSPAPELVEVLLRVGRTEPAERVATEIEVAAAAKGQPWSLARAARARALLVPDAELDAAFATALEHHGQTADAFETARTQLCLGERLRRTRRRRDAREPLRAALATFERLGATPWSERTRAELAASGETLRRRDVTSRDELTPQELQIAQLLAGGRTTREAAAAMFISPKTVEYHLRHVYLKLGVNSRAALAAELAPPGSQSSSEMIAAATAAPSVGTGT